MQLIEVRRQTSPRQRGCSAICSAGELIFLLIALMGGAWASVGPVGGVLLAAGRGWPASCGPPSLIIITLQAFVFMMLTLVYIGQAHDAH